MYLNSNDSPSDTPIQTQRYAIDDQERMIALSFEGNRIESGYPGLVVRSTWTGSPKAPDSQFYVLGLPVLSIRTPSFKY